MLILSVAVLYIMANGAERRAETPLARTPLMEQQFANVPMVPLTRIYLLTHPAAKGEIPEIGVAEEHVGPTVKMRRSENASTRDPAQPEKEITPQHGATATTANPGDLSRPNTESNKFHEWKKRQNVDGSGPESTVSTDDSASVPVTGVGSFETTQSLPRASDATNADARESTYDSSAVHTVASSLDTSDASALSAAASVSEPTESSLETSQLPQVPPETGPEEIADLSSDATGASPLSTSDAPAAAADASTPSDVTIDNTQGDAVTQKRLVDVSAASESASSLSLPEVTAEDHGSVTDSIESTGASVLVTGVETFEMTEPLPGASVSDEPSSAALTIMYSESMSFTEVITQVRGNSTEVNGISTNDSGAAMSPSSAVVDEHSEWHTERNLTDISANSTTPEMNAWTSRSRRTPRSRLPITERTRKPLPWSRLKVPNEQSLVCAITEDFKSYWLSFGFPFRYADVYPDHLCTHYIFSALVFDEFDETDFSLYPHNFYRLEKFIRMRKQSNVTFIVSFDADDLLRRLMAHRSSENMQLFANNVHVFLRFYDFDGFDIYKIHFTVENWHVWAELLKILNKELVSGGEYLLSVGFTYDDDVPHEGLAQALKHVTFSNLITHVAPIDIWNSTVAEPPNHFNKVKHEIERVQAVRKLQPDHVMCYTLTLCIAHYVVLEGTPFDPARGEFFNFHEMSCDRISEMDTEHSKADGMSIVSADGSIYYAYDTTATLLDKIRQLDPHGMCVSMFDVQCDDTDDCEEGRYSRIEAVKKEVGVLDAQRELMLQLRLRHGHL
ncbi:uncharacterized protein [Dermacentor albipictus]|uniref:uncharacterized protein n=1 Tax=Dermacentor albipictus TaxID=60249 RepID=UPI0038FD1CA2